MLKTVLAGALASGALMGGSAQAQGYGYGYDEGRPAYASAGYGYEPYRPRGFTLLGARAGVTVLGIDVDASAKLTVGAHGWGGGSRPTYYAPPQQGYAPPPPPEPAYMPAPQPMYVQPSWGVSYGYGYCGC